MKTGIRIATALMVLALSACGGDGGDSKPASSITGVAATGDAISGGTVTLKCKGGGSVSTVTGNDGRYTLQVDRLTLPCLAQVRFTDSHNSPYTLHSYVLAPGTINITPLTELITAVLLQHQPSDSFDNHVDQAFTLLSQGNQAAAWNTVKANLLAQGIQLPDNFNPVRDILQAKTGTQTGNAHDQLLDAAGFQLGLNFQLGSTVRDVSLDIQIAGTSPVTVNHLYWGSAIYNGAGTNGSSIPGFINSPQPGYTYSIDSNTTATSLATATSTYSLEGLYQGTLNDGNSCSFRINADGSVLLPAVGDAAEHLIPASAFPPSQPPLITSWGFAETESQRYGFLAIRAATLTLPQAVILWMYEQQQPASNCTATRVPSTAT